MESPEQWERLARYLAGEASEAEAVEVLAWARAEPGRQEELEMLRQVWEAGAAPGRRWNAGGAWLHLQDHLEGRPLSGPGEAVATTASARARIHRLGKDMLPWAAAAVLATVAVVGVLRLERAPGGVPDFAQLPAQELVTDNGQRARVRLSDGSHVRLAPGSRLEIPAGFGASGREVRLSGQAFFEVVPDPDHAFMVHAGGAVTRVVGTEFDVRAYPGDEEVRVVVAEGKVAFGSTRDGAEPAVLAPGDLGQLSGPDTQVLTRKVDLDAYLAWCEGRLSFDNAPLREVVREVERWYGVPLRIADASLASRRLTASFRDQPIAEVLEVIAASLGLQYARVGDTYMLHSREAPSNLAAE